MEIQALLLGVIQGITEFLPISSTAHLIVVPSLLGWEGPVNTLSFDIALHGGTLLALLLYFFRDLIESLRGDRRLILLLLLGTLPAAVVGLLFKDLVEGPLRTPFLVALNLVVFGFYMLFAEKAETRRGMSGIGLKDAMVIGVSQAIALLPGVSRSGITISTGLLLGIDRVSSARFSFLLSLPAVGGAVVLDTVEGYSEGTTVDWELFLLGALSSFVVGLICLRFLLWFFRGFSMKTFAYYRFVLAGIILTVLWLRG